MAGREKLPKLDYKLDATLLDGIYSMISKLKISGEYGRKVAGLCLLGEKDGVVDTFVPILTSKGCWDAPEVNHTMFYNAFIKMVEKDRRIVGMALVRPMNAGREISNEMISNIRNMKSSFEDIYKTIWLSVSDNDVFIYRVTGEKHRIVQIDGDQVWINSDKSIFMKISDTNLFIRSNFYITKHGWDIHARLSNLITLLERTLKSKDKKIDRDLIAQNADKELELIKKEMAVKSKEYNNEQLKIKKEKEKLEKKKREEAKKKLELQKKLEKEAVPIGNGYCLLKTKEGKEILWKM